MSINAADDEIPAPPGISPAKAILKLDNFITFF